MLLGYKVAGTNIPRSDLFFVRSLFMGNPRVQYLGTEIKNSIQTPLLYLLRVFLHKTIRDLHKVKELR